ncbi:MAG: tyrosine-protein phosphatase [Elusimicrobia bacterium]|nr:tyrosine-protein phosphatase [Elusimicrobiota bacterium]
MPPPRRRKKARSIQVLLDDAGKPLLIHCRRGVDRTGLISALYAFEFMGLAKDAARRDMLRAFGWIGIGPTLAMGRYLDEYPPGRTGGLSPE